jgi:hypothetical protein
LRIRVDCLEILAVVVATWLEEDAPDDATAALLEDDASASTGAASTRGNASKAASQLVTEHCEDDSGNRPGFSAPVVSARFSTGSGVISSGSPVFSAVGQMPSCSYRSKKLELVGGDARLMVVERERGSRTGLFGDTAPGTGGSGAEGGEVTGEGIDWLAQMLELWTALLVCVRA